MCVRRSSATATGSSTRRRSAGSSTRPRSSSRRRATTTARGSRTRSRRPGSRARSRARCALNEDLDRGDRARPRPRPPAVRPRGRGGARRALLRERFGTRFRHNEHSLRVVDVLERDGRGLNLTWRCATASSTTRGRTSPRRSRARSSGSSTASPTSTTTSTTRSARGCSREASCRARDRAARRRPGRARIDTLVHDLVETRRRGGDIARATRSARRCCRCATFMFERVYLGPQAQAGARAGRGDRPADLRPPRRHPRTAGRRRARRAITEFVAGMTDRFALAYAAAL